jgi:hypothetical protein
MISWEVWVCRMERERRRSDQDLWELWIWSCMRSFQKCKEMWGISSDIQVLELLGVDSHELEGRQLF